MAVLVMQRLPTPMLTQILQARQVKTFVRPSSFASAGRFLGSFSSNGHGLNSRHWTEFWIISLLPLRLLLRVRLARLAQEPKAGAGPFWQETSCGRRRLAQADADPRRSRALQQHVRDRDGDFLRNTAARGVAAVRLQVRYTRLTLHHDLCLVGRNAQLNGPWCGLSTCQVVAGETSTISVLADAMAEPSPACGLALTGYFAER